MHLQSISNFRAFAIILIVAGHTVSFGMKFNVRGPVYTSY